MNPYWMLTVIAASASQEFRNGPKSSPDWRRAADRPGHRCDAPSTMAKRRSIAGRIVVAWTLTVALVFALILMAFAIW